MCCKFYSPTNEELYLLRSLAGLFEQLQAPVKTGVVNPGDSVAVAANNRNRAMHAFAMQWGYHLPDGRLVFNTRLETAAEKPLFADGISRRRCLIPACCYYEWQKTAQGKQKFAISTGTDEGFLLGGIYRLEGKGAAFSVLTQPPAEEIAFIHDRMPVMLPDDAAEDWLNPGFRAEEIVKACPVPLRYTLAE